MTSIGRLARMHRPKRPWLVGTVGTAGSAPAVGVGRTLSRRTAAALPIPAGLGDALFPLEVGEVVVHSQRQVGHVEQVTLVT